MELWWSNDAACKGVPSFVFFPARDDVETLGRAKRICVDCLVRLDCLDHAIRYNEDGIWGGTSRDRRDYLRRVLLSGDPIAYHHALCEESEAIGRAYSWIPDDRPAYPEHPCSRCGQSVRAGQLPVDRNGPGASCGLVSTYNKGCRCDPCRRSKVVYNRRYPRRPGRSPRGERYDRLKVRFDELLRSPRGERYDRFKPKFDALMKGTAT